MLDQNEMAINKTKTKQNKRAAKSLWEIKESYLYGFQLYFFQCHFCSMSLLHWVKFKHLCYSFDFIVVLYRYHVKF